MKALALLLALLPAYAGAALFTCCQAGDNFQSISYATKTGTAAGDELRLTASFSTAVTAEAPHRLSITASTGTLVWLYTGTASALTIVAAAQTAGYFYLSGFNLLVNSTGTTALAVGAGTYPTGFNLWLSNFSATNVRTAVGGGAVLTSGAHNLTITVKRSSVVRTNSTSTSQAWTDGPQTVGTAVKYFYFENSLVASMGNQRALSVRDELSTFNAANSTFFTGSAAQALAFHDSTVSISLTNCALAGPSVTSDIFNAGSVSMPFLKLNVSNCGLTADSLTSSAAVSSSMLNNFRISVSDFRGYLGGDFRPVSGRSPLTRGGMSMSSFYTRDLIGAPWGTPWGAGAYYLPANLQPVGAGNLRAVPTQFLKVPTLVPVPTQFIMPIQ